MSKDFTFFKEWFRWKSLVPKCSPPFKKGGRGGISLVSEKQIPLRPPFSKGDANVRLVFIAGVALFMVSHEAFAISTPWRENPHGKVRLVSSYNVAPTRGTLWLGVEFQPIAGWHVYWKNAGDAGYAPKVTWEGSRGISNPQFLWPAPHRYDLPGDVAAFGYEKEVVYPVHAELSGDRIHAVAHLSYLTCGTICVPYKYDFELDIPVGAAPEADQNIKSLIERFANQVPLPVSSLEGASLVSTWRPHGPQASLHVTLKWASDTGVRDPAIFLEIIDGLSFGKPTVIEKSHEARFTVPVSTLGGEPAPSKLEPDYVITGIEKNGRTVSLESVASASPPTPFATPISPDPVPKGKRNSLAWIMFLAFVGGLILNVMPCVLPILSIKIFGLLQHGGQSRRIVARDALASAAGILLSFLLLALAAVFARRGGQAVGWGIQFQNPFFIAFLAIVLVLFTLNLWGLFEITLPAFLTRVGTLGAADEGVGSYFVGGLFATLLATPCSAPFLGTAMGFALSQPGLIILSIFSAVGFGMAFPYLVLAVFPGSMRWLPKPGAWMLRVRGVLGFFLAATVIWLGYVLSSQIDSVGMALFCLGLLGLGLLMWLREVFAEKDRTTTSWSNFGLLLTVGLLVWIFRVIQTHPRVLTPNEKINAAGISWIPFDEDRLSRELASGRSVFVDVTAEWCFTCKVNEKAVLQSDDVVSAFKKKEIVAMRADWTTPNAAIADYLKKFGRAGIPFYAYYQPGKGPAILSEFLTKRAVLEVLAPSFPAVFGGEPAR